MTAVSEDVEEKILQMLKLRHRKRSEIGEELGLFVTEKLGIAGSHSHWISAAEYRRVALTVDQTLFLQGLHRSLQVWYPTLEPDPEAPTDPLFPRRWDEGIAHHPKSLALMEHMMAVDYENGDDYCLKMGGDGDNGEHFMFLMDGFFEKE